MSRFQTVNTQTYMMYRRWKPAEAPHYDWHITHELTNTNIVFILHDCTDSYRNSMYKIKQCFSSTADRFHLQTNETLYHFCVKSKNWEGMRYWTCQSQRYWHLQLHVHVCQRHAHQLFPNLSIPVFCVTWSQTGQWTVVCDRLHLNPSNRDMSSFLRIVQI